MDYALVTILNFTQRYCALLTAELSECSSCLHKLVFNVLHISLTISRLFQYAYNNISISPIPLIVKYYTILLPAEHKHRQYNDRKRPDTYDPVTVVCPVHLFFMLNSFHAFFELVIRLSFHKFSFLNYNCIVITFIDKYCIL